jgi:nitrile hydratase accessory protein
MRRRGTLCTSISGTITLSAPEAGLEANALAELTQLPCDAHGPVFAEPWQASAFALAVTLSRQGHFGWKEWAGALAAELKASAGRGEPDDGSRYYHCWLAVLERMVAAKGLSDPATLLSCKRAWADAYRRTPHGKPVELARGDFDP